VSDGAAPRLGLTCSLQQFFSESFSDFNDDATIDDAMQKLGMASMEAKFADMTVNLLPHQILGVAFMLDKERTPRYRGGLLCDAMGLGKVSWQASRGQC
jgi:SNF2 family DNA or RNA helicase